MLLYVMFVYLSHLFYFQAKRLRKKPSKYVHKYFSMYFCTHLIFSPGHAEQGSGQRKLEHSLVLAALHLLLSQGRDRVPKLTFQSAPAKPKADIQISCSKAEVVVGGTREWGKKERKERHKGESTVSLKKYNGSACWFTHWFIPNCGYLL